MKPMRRVACARDIVSTRGCGTGPSGAVDTAGEGRIALANRLDSSEADFLVSAAYFDILETQPPVGRLLNRAAADGAGGRCPRSFAV
jgi:hypothetical protein